MRALGKLLRVCIVALVVATASLTAPAYEAGATCSTTWTTVPTQSPGSATNYLAQVSADSATDAWAIGMYGNTLRAGRPLVEHFDGTSWQVVPFKFPSGGQGYLSGVFAVSATDAWVTGEVFTPSGESPVVAEWNGATWAASSVATIGSSIQLDAISGTSSTDVWVTGLYSTPKGKTFVNHALIERFDGTGWTIASLPPTYGAELLTVSASSPTDVSALGYANNVVTGGQAPIAFHFDGSGWTQVSIPTKGYISSVSESSSTDGWSVGFNFGRTTSKGMVEHFDGSAWHGIAYPNPSKTSVNLFGVLDLSPTDVWVSGFTNLQKRISLGNHSYTFEQYHFEPLLQNYDGTSWQSSTLSGAGTPTHYLLLGIGGSGGSGMTVGASFVMVKQHGILQPVPKKVVAGGACAI
jgi:hypothetical protein